MILGEWCGRPEGPVAGPVRPCENAATISRAEGAQMFRIRRIYDTHVPANREAIAQVQAILREQFDGLDESDIEKLPQQLDNPLKARFRSILFVADDKQRHVRGFAMLNHAPDLKFCYLDYISAAASPHRRGRRRRALRDGARRGGGHRIGRPVLRVPARRPGPVPRPGRAEAERGAPALLRALRRVPDRRHRLRDAGEAGRRQPALPGGRRLRRRTPAGARRRARGSSGRSWSASTARSVRRPTWSWWWTRSSTTRCACGPRAT